MAWLAANLAFITAILAVVPQIVGDFWAFTLALFLLYAVACLGLGLSWGQAGLLSLGQGFFLGFSAYTSGLILIGFSTSVWLFPLLGLSVIAPGLIAYLFGCMIFHGRTRNTAFFAIITLALILLAAQIATSWESVTGGYNGLRNIPGLPGLSEFEDAYTLSAVALGLSMMFVAWIMQTPLGVLWRALSQDERRVAFLGFNHNQLKSVAFGLSGLFGGIAGTLYAPQNSLVTPDLFGFLLSTSFVVWVAIGGRNTLYGPVLGAIGIGLATNTLRESIGFWEVILAVIFIVAVLYFRKGVAGTVEPAIKRWFERGARVRKSAPARHSTMTFDRISIENLNLSVGNVGILEDLNLNIGSPGIYCLIGPNGAGKTTIFNAMTGELEAQSGTVSMLGTRGIKMDARTQTIAGLGRKFQVPSVFDQLTVGENLAIALWSGRPSRCDLLRMSLLDWESPVLTELERRFPFLTDRRQMVGNLSHGQRQILDLAMVLCTEPRLILLDEPCAGLSLAETNEVISTVRWAVDRFQATAMIIEHDMAMVRELADHVFVLHNGSMLFEGSVAEVQSNAAVQAVYTGGTK